MAQITLLFVVFVSFVSLGASGPVNLVNSWTTAVQRAVRTAGGDTPRSYSLTNLAIYRTLTTTKLSRYPGANVNAAASFAAHFVLSTLYPGLQSSIFDGVIASELKTLNLTAAQFKSSQALGELYGLAIIKSRSNDKSQRYTPFTPADPLTALPGQYQFTPNQTFAQVPGGGKVTPLVPGINPKDFDTTGGPYKVSSAAFQADLEEVKAYGEKGSTVRSLYQTQTAIFWSTPANTSALSRQYYEIARSILPSNLSLLQTSKIFTLIALSQFEANVIKFHLKYKYLFWRPVTAIRKNSSTANWLPLLATPGHPDYPSGHAVSTGAFAGVFASALGVTVDFDFGLNFTALTEAALLPSRNYSSLKQVVDDDDNSRVFGGVHFRKAVKDGSKIGIDLGKKIYLKFK